MSPTGVGKKYVGTIRNRAASGDGQPVACEDPVARFKRAAARLAATNSARGRLSGSHILLADQWTLSWRLLAGRTIGRIRGSSTIARPGQSRRASGIAHF